VEAPKAMSPASRAVIRDVFSKRAMLWSPFVTGFDLAALLTRIRWFGHC
jgi:hypothetical protein